MASGDRNLNEIADNLLAYLRNELKDAGVGYLAPPVSLLGGYETQLVRFQLDNAPDALAGPLVLRIFPASQPSNRATWESAVQNSLAEQGVPVPRVHLTGTDTSLFNGPFLIMQFVPGKTMLQAEPDRTPALLGTAHAELHNLPTQPLVNALQARGISADRLHFKGRLSWLSSKAADHPWLAEALRWLVDKRPVEPAELSLCHGDFHPLNILMNEGQVSAILDWSGFSIGDAAMDVAFTDIILSIAAREILPNDDVDVMLASYYATYEAKRRLYSIRLDYYRTVRCVMALIEGAEGQAVWTNPAAIARLTEWIRQITGIRVSVPG